MLEQLNLFDQQIFLLINKELSNVFFDWLMPLIRNRFFWSPVYVFLVAFMLMNYKKNGWLMILFLLVTFGLADFSSSGILKPIFERLRPCNDPLLKDNINLLVACGGGFSMPSSHATNHFGIAMFLSVLFFERSKWVVPLTFLWAFSIAFAQVYVGVHYPFDVTAGAILGCAIGYITGTIFLSFYAHRIWKPGL